MSPLPRYRKRQLNPFGKGTERKRPVRRVEYEAVSRRAQGVCEMPLCSRRQDPLDPHHTFGRGHLPGIPAAACETRELILGVCRECHDKITGGDISGDIARRIAIERFALHYGLDFHRGAIPIEGGERLVDVMRELVRQYEIQEDISDYAAEEIKRERDHGAPI